MRRQVTRALALAATAVWLAACLGCGGEATDTPAKTCSTLPGAHECLADWCQNELGVGRPCTKGGGECGANDQGDVLGAVLCTADPRPDEAKKFCTLPCVDDVDCGKGAVCRGDPDSPGSGKGCVLEACAGEAPADADATQTDASSTDAAAGDAGSLPDAVTADGQ